MKKIIAVSFFLGLFLIPSAMALEVGESAPDFTLPAVDGNTYSIASFQDKTAVVVVFTCNHCPYAQAYEDRIVELQRDYQDKSVQVVAINPNDAIAYPDDGFDGMVKRAQEKGFNFPYLRDESQEIAHAYGAVRTPHIFLLGPDRTLVYTGKIDDNWEEPAAVKTRFLRDAIDAVLAGSAPDPASTPAIGCTIKWKK